MICTGPLDWRRNEMSDEVEAIVDSTDQEESVEGWKALSKANGVVYIKGTTIAIRRILALHLTHGWGAKAIQEELPRLTIAQIHCALGYYYDEEES